MEIVIRNKTIVIQPGDTVIDNGVCIQLERNYPSTNIIIPKKTWADIQNKFTVTKTDRFLKTMPNTVLYTYETKESVLLNALIQINGMCADAANIEGGKLDLDEVAKISMDAIKKVR